MAQVTLDGIRSVEATARNAEAIAAQQLVNSGAAAFDGAGPINDPDGLLSGGGKRAVTTWADPSSQG
jgi:hypothetical protein